MATRDVYTDGSVASGWWRATRAAWATVAIDAQGEVVWTQQGVCGEPQASIYRAELTAVLETLRVAVPPLTIHVDNAAVVQGIQDGKQATTRAGREAADLWRQVWHLMDEIGDGVRVSKVKAHTSWWDVWDGKITLRDRGGNEAADAAAKAMLNEALLEAPIRNFSVQAARAMLWAKWIVKYASDWLDDADPMDDVPAVPAERRERGESESNKLEHQVWEDGNLSMCSRCGRQEQLRAGRRGYRVDA